MASTLYHRRQLRLLTPVLLSLSAIAGAAPAWSATPTLGACAAIASDQARLACYDRVSGRVATAPVTTPMSEPAPKQGPELALDPVPASAPPSAPISAPMNAPAATGPTTASNTQSESAAPAVTGAAPESMIDAAWGFNPDSARYSIDVYRPNYLLLASYSSRKNNVPFQSLFDLTENPDAEMNSTEAEFQISFKARLWATKDRRFGVWGAYTQQSQWQVYNAELSRPFRETNYNPELMVSFRPGLSLGDAHWRLFNFGYAHQSNGRSDPISRSWDRLIAQFGVEWGNLALLVRPWLVIDDGGNDNPDITDYYGHGDITAIYRLGEHRLSLMARGHVDTKKGAARFSWTSPRLIGPLRGYVSAFTGYGETMIDYNWKQSVIGVGFTLNSEL